MLGGLVTFSGGHAEPASDALVREQYALLRTQIPLMYLLMAVNTAFLTMVTSKSMPPLVSFAIPGGLTLVSAVRAGVWLARGRHPACPALMRRRMRTTVIMAAVLSCLYGSWGLYLFSETAPQRAGAIALYVFLGAIGCCYCLQALPSAARLVMLFGAAPMTVRLLVSPDWYMVGTGVIFVIVAVVVLFTLASSRSALAELLRSRSEMSLLLDELRQSQEHHRHSVDLNPQIPWISRPDGSISEIGARWTAITGFSISESLGGGWAAAVHPQDLPEVRDKWLEAVRSSASSTVDLRYRLLQADGSYRWVRARAFPRVDEQGEVVAWYGNLEDIDDQLKAESALRESEERYRLASRATNDLIWDWSLTSGIINWTEGVESIFGYTEAAKGTTEAWWQAHVHPDDLALVQSMHRDVMEGRRDNWSHEFRFLAADGNYLHLLSRGYVVRDDQGRAQRGIGALQDITKARQDEQALRRAAFSDSLTGLSNRAHFTQVLGAALAGGGAAAVAVMDIDNFKWVNDTLGHGAGDHVLRMVGDRILDALPSDGTAARLGGDEFAIFLPIPTAGMAKGAPDARIATVGAILDRISRPIDIGESIVEVRASAGFAIAPENGKTAEDVLSSADLALYDAKSRATGGLLPFAPKLRDAANGRMTMLREAREALRDDRVVPFYQPKIDLETRGIAGFEALLRWQHRERGLQPPRLIEAAFRDGALATRLTDRMLNLVLADVRRWRDAGLEIGKVAINGASADFSAGDFADRILSNLHAMGLPPSVLELEVTETVFLGQVAHTVDKALRMLIDEGVSIAFDDFGTGYASLAHLLEFPVDVLKIDRSFVARLTTDDPADYAIIPGIIDMARRMDVRTVAEGVETPGQMARLRELGCNIAQGYLFGRALSADRVESYLKGWIRGELAHLWHGADDQAVVGRGRN